jgi:hypothetical protein
MNGFQRLFLVQARTDFVVYELLSKQAKLPHCHALHYLLMSTELLGKALAWKTTRPNTTHRAFVKFLRALATNSEGAETTWVRGAERELEPPAPQEHPTGRGDRGSRPRVGYG